MSVFHKFTAEEFWYRRALQEAVLLLNGRAEEKFSCAGWRDYMTATDQTVMY